ncbi:MAG: hypothetical protein ACYTKD_22330 [Planctomycetota bacterium]|jgi:hypothetical protein
MPEDALGQLAGIEGLAPREAILARALVRHKLAPAEQVLCAARAAAEDPAGGGVLDRLSAEGLLTEERARGIEKALEKQLAGRRAAAASAPPSTPGDEEIEDVEPVEEAEPVEKAAPVEADGSAGEAPSPTPEPGGCRPPGASRRTNVGR